MTNQGLEGEWGAVSVCWLNGRKVSGLDMMAESKEQYCQTVTCLAEVSGISRQQEQCF